MSIRMGFLALLAEHPMNGYQLRQEFEARTGGTWPLNIGQAYTTLQRLERDGLVMLVESFNSESEQYELTESGWAESRAWWKSPVERGAPARDELAMKLALAVGVLDVEGIQTLVQRQRKETLKALRDYTKLKARAEPPKAPKAPDKLGWLLVLDSLIFQAEAEVRWLDHVEHAVVRAAASNATPSGAGTTLANPNTAPRVRSIVDAVAAARQGQSQPTMRLKHQAGGR